MRKSHTWLSVPVVVRVVALLSVLLVPRPAHADIVFTWVPTDGTPSSGTMTIDAPLGPLSLFQSAVTSFDFTFRPGLSVHLAFPPELTSLPIVSFDGSGLDYGDFVLSRFRYPVTSVFGFLPEQLGADRAVYDQFGDRGPSVIVHGKWTRTDVTPPALPPYPRGILNVIDIRPVVNSHLVDRTIPSRTGANVLGVAYDPDRDVLYVSHGSDPRGGLIYTLDLSGHLLAVLDFQRAYRPNSYPTSLSYDRSTGRLFVFAFTELAGGVYIGNMVEMSPDGSAIFNEVALPNEDVGYPMVREDGIWRPSGEGSLRHYSSDGVFIEDVAVAGSFPPSSGPSSVASSPIDATPAGFLLIDDFGQRIIDVDRVGHERADVTTAVLGDTILKDGRGSAITFDPSGRRIFLIGGGYVFVLSPEYLKIQNINSLLQLHEDIVTSFDPTPVPAGRAGTFTIHAKFDNVSDHDLCNMFFQVVRQTGVQRLEQISIAPTGQQVQGFDQIIIGHQPLVLPAHDGAAIDFRIDLSSLDWFELFVDVWGTPQAAGSACP